jgi:hypothetical protein
MNAWLGETSTAFVKTDVYSWITGFGFVLFGATVLFGAYKIDLVGDEINK